MSTVDFQFVRELAARGIKQTEIARQCGISRSYVSDIVCGRVGYSDDAEAVIQGLKDDRSAAKSRLNKALRAEYLFTEAARIASNVKPLKTVKPPKFEKRAEAVQETAFLLLSDGHHDQVVKPDSVGGLEDYNFNVSLRRAQVLTDATIKFCTRTLVGYDFDRIVVGSLGDSTSGEIHEAEKRSAFGNQFKNALAIGALHASIYRDLAAHFPRVEVHCVSGNHGRRTPGKEYAGGPHNNWDYMCNKIAAAYCADLPNVSFNIPDSFSTVVDVQGFGFHLSHGDDIAGSTGNPWSGLRKRHEKQAGIHRGKGAEKSFRRGAELDYHCIGHHHTRGIVNGNGVGFICNGAWLATDPFAYEKLGVAGPAEQVLFGVHKDRGMTWQLPINLHGSDKAKTCRYDHILDLVQ